MSRKPIGAWRSPQDTKMWRQFDNAMGMMAAAHDHKKNPVGADAPLDGTFLSHKREFVRWPRPRRKDGTRLPGVQVRPLVIREVAGKKDKHGRPLGGRFVSRVDHEDRVARYREMARKLDEAQRGYKRRKRS